MRCAPLVLRNSFLAYCCDLCVDPVALRSICYSCHVLFNELRVLSIVFCVLRVEHYAIISMLYSLKVTLILLHIKNCAGCIALCLLLCYVTVIFFDSLRLLNLLHALR